jgi:AcrR family transcriptional regulator
MKVARQDSMKTRSSLLGAAGRIFAEKGYHEATIAEISETAGANIAAVNYHFGDKETLYREAWRRAFRDSIEAHPPDGGVPANAPAEQRLRGQIRALLERISDEENREFSISHKELASPTGLLEEVMREELEPLRSRIEAVIGEIIGGSGSKGQARFCTLSVMSQCVIPAVITRVEKACHGGEHAFWRVDDIEAYAQHVIAFSLAGIEAAGHETKAGRPQPRRGSTYAE